MHIALLWLTIQRHLDFAYYIEQGFKLCSNGSLPICTQVQMKKKKISLSMFNAICYIGHAAKSFNWWLHTTSRKWIVCVRTNTHTKKSTCAAEQLIYHVAQLVARRAQSWIGGQVVD